MKKLSKKKFYYYLFDWANSPYSTVIITFIFSTYFVNTIASSKVSGTSLWGWTLAASGFLIAVLGPVLGQAADKRNNFSKYFMVLATIAISIGCLLLWYVKPTSNFICYTLIIILVTNTLFELSQIFYNSKLLEFKDEKSIGQFSGTAWAFGYLGGIICLLLILISLVLPENNLFGLNKGEYEHIRFCGVIVAIWYLLFSIPFLKNFNNQKAKNKKIFFNLNFLYRIFSSLKNKNILRFLIARMFYTDGLITLFSFGGIYASGNFGFSFNEIIYFGIALNISAALGSYIFGFLEDKIGSKNIILLSLISLIVICTIILLIKSKILFWLLGVTIGFFIGSIQSSSRTTLIRISNGKNLNSMFGLYAVSGKVTNFLGPLFFASLTTLFDSQKAGMTSIILFLIFGLIFLYKTKI